VDKRNGIVALVRDLEARIARKLLMKDDDLLRQLAALFHVEKDGRIIWPWMTGATLAEVGSPELETALTAYRTRIGIANVID
jgi:hypothetical protein